jgi:phosphopantothenoylcysteine decarboxylase/phosphopantothenate--cysteine ligase
MSLRGKKITVGLTGGIACYKVPYLIRALVKEGAEVHVVMTNAATKFITPLTLETVSGRPVSVDLFPEGEYVATRHIDLAQNADLLVIAPATANFLGKIAAGISDDLLTTVVCAASAPVLIAPAMNPQMWHSPVTQRNVKTLTELGYRFVGPAEGEMACEASGIGRMVEPDEIFRAVVEQFARPKKKALKGKRIVVTAGPTRESIDPVRFISNQSSGKMGYAIAWAAVTAGADTVLITGPSHELPPVGCEIVKVVSTEELLKAVQRAIKGADCLIMAAAPADYRPAVTAAQKLKKGHQPLTLRLEPTVDILKSLRRSGSRPVMVGFALETEDALMNARKKLKDKNLDLIVVNQVSDRTGFDADTNQVTLIAPGRKPEKWPLMTKTEVAGCLLERLTRML